MRNALVAALFLFVVAACQPQPVTQTVAAPASHKAPQHGLVGIDMTKSLDSLALPICKKYSRTDVTCTAHRNGSLVKIFIKKGGTPDFMKGNSVSVALDSAQRPERLELSVYENYSTEIALEALTAKFGAPSGKDVVGSTTYWSWNFDDYLVRYAVNYRWAYIEMMTDARRQADLARASAQYKASIDKL